jgi:hypothetical protein
MGGDDRFAKVFEVVSFPEVIFRKLFPMRQKGVKVLSRCNVGKKSERGYFDFDKAEFTFLL